MMTKNGDPACEHGYFGGINCPWCDPEDEVDACRHGVGFDEECEDCADEADEEDSEPEPKEKGSK